MRFPISAEISNYKKSYRAGLVQAKAFRVLKKRTNTALAPFSINSTDWGVLGLLFDHRDGLAFKTIASEMGVKAPYITRSIATLSEKGFCSLTSDAVDGRIKIARITKAGIDFVTKTEPAVMKTVTSVFSNVSKRNALGYLMTILSLSKQNQNDIEDTSLDHIM